MVFLLSSPYLEIIVHDDNSWVLLKLMCFLLLQLFEPMGLVKKSVGPLKTMKAPKSAVEERHILRLLVDCSVVGSVCLEISDIAFDGINLVTALGAYATHSKQKLKPMKK